METNTLQDGVHEREQDYLFASETRSISVCVTIDETENYLVGIIEFVNYFHKNVLAKCFHMKVDIKIPYFLVTFANFVDLLILGYFFLVGER